MELGLFYFNKKSALRRFIQCVIHLLSTGIEMWLDLRLRGHKYKSNIKIFLITRVLCLSRALHYSKLYTNNTSDHTSVLGWSLLKLCVNSANINLGKDKLSNDTLLLKMQNLKNYCECELSVYHFLKAQKQWITISAGCRCLFFLH